MIAHAEEYVTPPIAVGTMTHYGEVKGYMGDGYYLTINSWGECVQVHKSFISDEDDDDG